MSDYLCNIWTCNLSTFHFCSEFSYKALKAIIAVSEQVTLPGGLEFGRGVRQLGNL